MTDRYENIRRALAMGPTHGPWHATKPEPHGTEVRGPAQVSLAWCGGATTVGEEGCYSIGAAEAAANAHFIAACEPDTIRELLAERDQLAAALEAAREDAARLDWLASKAPHLYVDRDRGCYELPYFDITSGRECCDPGDLRAAIDRARGKGVA